MMRFLVIGTTFAFAAAVQPGPFLAYIISETMKNGWRSTLPASFAPIISDIPIALSVLLLLSTVPDSFVLILRFGGGLFLLFLAYKAFKSWQQFDNKSLVAVDPSHKTFFKAVLVNLLNPGPYLGWSLIMGPLFLEGWAETPGHGITLVIGFYVTMVVTLAGIIILFGFASRLGPRVCKLFVGLSSVALGAFGIYQLILGMQLVGMFK
jgi:threonine/homoserine/homoserine lactone efflux protein